MKRLWQNQMAVRWAVLLTVTLTTAGCGNFVARRMIQSPNTYPQWLSPQARVELAFDDKFLTSFPAHFAEVGPPTARLRYRIVDPANYEFGVTSTNWMHHRKPFYSFVFNAKVPGATNAWTAHPRGTVILLHGYGVAQFAMSPWALRLAQEGWRCVLVDLRGHGKSTGSRIYYGMQETYDLSELLDQLSRDGQLIEPVAAVGESYGASISLRWKAVEPRVESVVAIAPYAVLSNVVLNICDQYAHWMPSSFPKAGIKKLPKLLCVPPEELDTTTILARSPVAALFVAGGEDQISPLSEVERLEAEAAPGSKLIVIPKASHESVTYFFNGLVNPVLTWLNRSRLETETASTSVSHSSAATQP